QIGRLAAWKEARPERLVIVAGCAAERMKDDLQKRFPHVDLVVGAKSIEDFPKLVDQAIAERFNREDDLVQPRINRMDRIISSDKSDSSVAKTTVSAFVTIMRGCNYSCTYCIVP